MQFDLLDSKRLYVRHISHELRTPLNTAFLGLKLLSTDLMMSDDPKDAERYDTLCDVNISCKAAVDILNDLLCYEKLESGILELHRENIPIIPFLQDGIAMFSVQARECGVTMKIVTEATNLIGDARRNFSLQPHDAIYADKFKMDQVIRNLISNALKFTPKGGTVTVRATFIQDRVDRVEVPATATSDNISVKRADTNIQTESGSKLASHKGKLSCWERVKEGVGLNPRPRKIHSLISSYSNPEDPALAFAPNALNGKLVVVVMDTGAGISARNQERIFKDIVQFSPEKLQAGGGSGLGLWITGGIVDLHSGKICVYSEGEGLGTTFTLEMPMTQTPPPDPTVRRSSLMEKNSVFWVLESPVRSQRLQSVRGSREYPVGCMAEFEDSNDGAEDGSVKRRDALKFDLLVVDDSRLNRKMLLKCLLTDGHVCAEATDGIEAVAKVKERMDLVSRGIGKHYDAILMDFIMPNMDGPTATRAIRVLGYTAPIFGVTGNGERESFAVIQRYYCFSFFSYFLLGFSTDIAYLFAFESHFLIFYLVLFSSFSSSHYSSSSHCLALSHYFPRIALGYRTLSVLRC